MDDPATTVNEKKTTSERLEIVEDISSTHLHLTRNDLTFRPRYNLLREWGMGDNDRTYNSLGFSLESSPAKSYGYGVNYYFITVSDDDGGDEADDFRSHNFSINGRYAVTQRIGITGSQSVVFSEDKDRTPTAETRSYKTDLGVNLYLHRTFSIDLRGTKDYTDNVGNGHNEVMTLTGKIKYAPAYWLTINSFNTYLDTKSEASVGGNSITGSTYSSASDSTSYSTSNSMEIKINRSFRSRTGVDYSGESDRLNSNSSTLMRFVEGFEYNLLSKGFRTRSLFNLTGEIDYTESRSDYSDSKKRSASLGFNHYPYRFVAWGASGRYSVSSATSESVTRGGSIYTAFPFPKMQLNATYSFEKNDSDGSDYDAHNLMVKLTKVF